MRSGQETLPIVHRAALSDFAQLSLVADLAVVIKAAPFYTPTMPVTGRPFSVQMTNCGPLGWVSDKAEGYRYQEAHPITGRPWPPMPTAIAEIWRRYSGHPDPPDACLVNMYAAEAKMGLHRDKDEEDFSAPVVSISLGDDCLFRVGGTKRGGPTTSLRLRSGDVLVLGGETRLAYHGVDRIYPGTSAIELPVPEARRINLTLRRARG
ncbi:MAG: alpha-ketoglutarate-dependent dioxygenase AlkB family protein [Alphaproteobacteria bacterium]